MQVQRQTERESGCCFWALHFLYHQNVYVCMLLRRWTWMDMNGYEYRLKINARCPETADLVMCFSSHLQTGTIPPCFYHRCHILPLVTDSWDKPIYVLILHYHHSTKTQELKSSFFWVSEEARDEFWSSRIHVSSCSVQCSDFWLLFPLF